MTYLDLTESTAPANATAGITTPEPHDRSLGELVSAAAADLSTLVRKEVALAKAEIAESVKSAGIGAGALGGAGLTATYGLLFLSLAAMFGLDAAGLPLYGAALVIAAFWLLLAGGLGLLGTRKLGDVGGVPRTAKTLKEDVEWARHPTS
ncbi:MAG TPA: phage holin family protein [Mycobacteriales bacterium]|nr:phage holin family protein [Mycobacteriales bacterium]